MTNILDLPIEAADGEVPLLLDANAGFYEAREKGNAYVYVEKYAINKNNYIPLKIGTANEQRPKTYLVKETNYTDIGGGFISFERHYAVVPDSWFDYQVVSYKVVKNTIAQSIFGQDDVIIGSETLINDAESTISGNEYVFRVDLNTQNTVLAKAIRKYYLEKDLSSADLQINNRQISFRGSPFIGGSLFRLVPDNVQVYLGDIYEVTSFEVTLSSLNV
mgnify:CR=1 FL=1